MRISIVQHYIAACVLQSACSTLFIGGAFVVNCVGLGQVAKN